MALKFLNKKGWHTGSLRNIENVWKAEQKHEAEQRKLEELRKQIQDERERSEFRLLQEQAGLVPRQERLEFLYDSGLSVGKSIGSGGASGSGGSGVAFKALEETAPGSAARADGSSSSSVAPAAAKESAAVPGALFEDKPHSANDAWRKLHSDPLLLIRQREQEALARIKNNPVQMALIRKSVAAKKEKGESHDEKEDHRKKHKKHKKHSSSREQFDSEDSDASGRKRKKTDDHKSSKHDWHYHKERVHSEDESEREGTRRKSSHRDSKYRDRSPDHISESKAVKVDGKNHTRKDFDQSRSERHSLNGHKDPEAGRHERGTRRSFEEGSYKSSTAVMPQDSGYRRRKPAPKLSEEERAARLQEMQMDAELHEEQRWKRVRKADEDDAREATHASKLRGRSFLDAAHKSVYGAEKGGSSTIEESVRRRTHYSQRSSGEGNSNAFRR